MRIPTLLLCCPVFFGFSTLLAQNAGSRRLPDISPASARTAAAMRAAQAEELDRAERAKDPEGWALKHLKKDASRGEVNAQIQLGDRFRDGKGVPKSLLQAAEWYEKAATQGDTHAQFTLGTMYKDGEGVPKNPAQAALWFGKAAAKGDAFSQWALGYMYAQGEGVPKSEKIALELYGRAAAQGNAFGQLFLGYMYEQGKGIPKDDAKAVEWFLKAAAKDNSGAQSALASHYATGAGVIKDDVRALAWMSLAATSGTPEVRKRRDEFEKRLTAEGKAKAEKLALDFFAKTPKDRGTAELSKQVFVPQKTIEEVNKLRIRLSDLDPGDPDYGAQIAVIRFLANNSVATLIPTVKKEIDDALKKEIDDALKDAEPSQKPYEKLRGVINLAEFTKRGKDGEFMRFYLKKAQDAAYKQMEGWVDGTSKVDVPPRLVSEVLRIMAIPLEDKEARVAAIRNYLDDRQ